MRQNIPSEEKSKKRLVWIIEEKRPGKCPAKTMHLSKESIFNGR
jgi:hypothetical protein